jgi:nucleotide-binding universal stress UspA family protein
LWLGGAQKLRMTLSNILVPVDGSDASMEAVHMACTMAKRNKGKVYVVYVIEVHRSLPLDADLSPEAAKGEEILNRAEQRAEVVDFPVEGELLQARDAGHAIVDEAIERGVDGIILGVGYKRSLAEGAALAWPRGGKPAPLPGEFRLGKITQYVLENAPGEVWLIRLPMVE